MSKKHKQTGKNMPFIAVLQTFTYILKKHEKTHQNDFLWCSLPTQSHCLIGFAKTKSHTPGFSHLLSPSEPVTHSQSDRCFTVNSRFVCYIHTLICLPQANSVTACGGLPSRATKPLHDSLHLAGYLGRRGQHPPVSPLYIPPPSTFTFVLIPWATPIFLPFGLIFNKYSWSANTPPSTPFTNFS